MDRRQWNSDGTIYPMKFAIINDIHNGPADSGFWKDIQRKLTFESERLVKKFVSEMNTNNHPTFVVNLGDFIEDVYERGTDIDYLKNTYNLLKSLDMPLYSLIGNHDVRTLTENEVADILGYEKMYYSFDHEAFHFVVLSFEITGDGTSEFDYLRAEVSQEQLEWLAADLQTTDKPTVIFTHYGLADDDMKGNFWFEENPHFGLLHNRKDVRKILEDSGKVKAVISGHQHWNRMKIHNNIPYIVVTSLVENFNNDGTPAEAYSLVSLDEKGIVVEVIGNDPAKFEYSFE